MTIYNIPKWDVWERYDKSIRFNMIQNYHCRLAAKSAYYVQPFDNVKGYVNGYYTTESLQDIEHDNGFKVVNCNWRQSEWHTVPLELHIHKRNGTVRKEYYAERTTSPIHRGHDRELIGVSVNDKWIFKHVTVKKSQYCNEYLTYDFKNNSIAINSSKGMYGKNSNGYYKCIGGMGTAETVYIKKPESYMYDVIQWFIDKLSNDKYKGFYNDVIKQLENY